MTLEQLTERHTELMSSGDDLGANSLLNIINRKFGPPAAAPMDAELSSSLIMDARRSPSRQVALGLYEKHVRSEEERLRNFSLFTESVSSNIMSERCGRERVYHDLEKKKEAAKPSGYEGSMKEIAASKKMYDHLEDVVHFDDVRSLPVSQFGKFCLCSPNCFTEKFTFDDFDLIKIAIRKADEQHGWKIPGRVQAIIAMFSVPGQYPFLLKVKMEGRKRGQFFMRTNESCEARVCLSFLSATFAGDRCVWLHFKCFSSFQSLCTQRTHIKKCETPPR
jgi:hypothetical protein